MRGLNRSERHGATRPAPSRAPDRRVAPGISLIEMLYVADSGGNKNSGETQTRHGSRLGNPGACGDSWRGAACPRSGNPLVGSTRQALDQCEGVIERTWGPAGECGTLWLSLGFVTRDSPKEFVCSSSLRGVTHKPSRYVIKKTTNTITFGERTQPRRPDDSSRTPDL